MDRVVADYLRRGVALWAEDGKLRYRMSPALRDAGMLTELAGRKAELLAELAPDRAATRWHAVSDNQAALYVHQALFPDDAAYNVTVAMRLRRAPDAADVRRALLDLAGAHPSLRRVYARAEAVVYQRTLGEDARIPLESACFDDAGVADIAAVAFARRPFALDGALLIRACLTTTAGADDATLHLCVHHLNIDFWSLGLIVRDLRAALDGARLSRSAADRYLDHVSDRLMQPAPEAQRHYWRDRIAKHYQPFTLPVAMQAANTPDTPAARASRIAFSIVGQRRAAIEAAAARAGASAFVIVLAAYLLTIARLADTARPSACVPTFGRSAGQQDVVGYFVNPLPIFADLGETPTIGALVAALKRQVAEALDADAVPFAWIADQARPKAGDSAQAFPAFLNWNALPPDALSGDMRSVELDQVGGFCASMLTITELTGEYRAVWAFDSASAPHGERWLARLLETIDWIAADETSDGVVHLDALPCLIAADRAIIDRANATAVSHEPARSLARLIVERCAIAPSAVALRFRGETMSYAELDRRSQAVAAALVEQGVGAGDFVGLCLERCADMVVALLGIVRAGAAFVPLEPSLPARRLADMIADAGVRVVLSHAATQAHPALADCVRLDASSVSVKPGAPVVADDVDAPAYLLFTSGSTGRPKGVVVTHRAIHNRLFWMQRAYGLGPDDRVLQKTPASFDVSVWEFFWPLLFGASLVVAEPDGHKDPEYLRRTIETDAITHIHFVPSMLSVYLQYLDGPQRTALRHVYCSGEALPPPTVGDFFARHPGVRLHNLYGPTEAAVDVSFFECRPADRRRATVPIGRPVDNTRLHVLDAELRPLPVGVAGELFIEGVQLALGYHGRPDLTAARFLSVPDEEVSRRMYRTGDLASWNADGELEYHGRADDQIKLRGQRIELGEIVSVLLEHPSVRLAACALADGVATMIVAAVVLGEEQAGDNDVVLREHLLARLPASMVPAAIVAVPSLPVTQNGKLDRAALVALCLASEQSGAGVRAGTSAGAADDAPLLPDLLAAWRRALGPEAPSGRDANFFMAGGDSIRALGLIGALRERGHQIDAHRLYKTPGLGALDDWLRANAPVAAPTQTQPIAPFSLMSSDDRADAQPDCEDGYPLTILQEVMHAHTLMRRGLAIYHDVFTIHLSGAVDPDALGAAIQRATDAHAVLRTRVRSDRRGGFVQQVQARMRADHALSFASAGEFHPALAALVQAEKAAPFDFERGPLIRFRHLIAGSRQALILCFHHLILDGWSVASLIQQILRPAHLPAPAAALRFADYVALERAAADDPTHRAHWAARLSRAPVTLVGPTATRPDHLQVATPVDLGGIAHTGVPLSARLEQGLRETAARLGVPLKSICMALHCRMLMAFLGHDAVTTGYVVDGRVEAPDYEAVLGLHLNTVPLVAEERERLDAFVQDLRAQEIDNLPHRRFPLLHMVRDDGGRRRFNTVCNFTDFHIYRADPAMLSLVDDIEVHEFTDFDLVSSFGIHPATGRLIIRVDYRTGLLERSDLDRLLAVYALAIERFADPDSAERRVGELNPALAAADRQLANALPAIAARSEIAGIDWRDTDGRGRRVVRVVPAAALLPHFHHRPRWSTPLRHRLADGLEVACVNRTETDFNHQELFVDGMLARHRLALPADAILFDVGANIGLFALFLHASHPGATIYAFEPAPTPFLALAENLAAYSVPGRAIPCALGASPGRATMGYYAANTLMSGFHTDEEDYDVSLRALLNARATGSAGDQAALRAMLGDKLGRQHVEVDRSSVSHMMRELNLPRIDLLKVDVEKAELDVLAGVAEADWPRIAAVFVEVHDIDGRLGIVLSLLQSHGFACLVEQDRMLAGTDIHSVLATRAPPTPRGSDPAPWIYAEAAVAASIESIIGDQADLPPDIWSLSLRRAHDDVDAATSPGRSPPREAIMATAPALSAHDEALLGRVWASVLGDRPLALDRSLYDQGVDSISMLRLLRAINVAFDCSITVASVNADLTPASLLALRGQGAVTIIESGRVGHAPTLVLVTPFGASPEVYRSLAAALSGAHAVRIVSLAESAYRGRDLGAVALDHWADLLPALTGADLLVGWSLGGNLALALSDRWRATTGTGLPVALLDSYTLDETGDEAGDETGDADGRIAADEALALMRFRPTQRIARGLYVAATIDSVDRFEGALSSRAFLTDATECAVSADHFEMLRMPHAASVAEAIAAYVATEARP